MIEESLWKIVGFLLCVIMLFIAPLISIYERQENITYQVVKEEAERFSDIVRDSGKITKKDRSRFLSRLGATGNTYTVEMEHLEKKYIEDKNGNIQIYYNGRYNEDIHKALETKGEYKVKAGDFFYINIKNSSRTKKQVIYSALGLGGKRIMSIYVVSGGMIRDGDA